MAIAKMKLINMSGDLSDLQEVLAKFAKLDYFHPELASKMISQVHGATTLEEETKVLDDYHHLKEMKEEMKIETTHIEEFRKKSIKEMFRNVERVYDKFKIAQQVRKEIVEVIQENKDALVQLEHVANMNLNLDDLFACKYIKVRFGRLPLDSVKKLAYYESHPFLFKSFQEDHTYSWCFYLTSEKYETDVDNIFSSLYFERIFIPGFVHGTIDGAVKLLKEEIENDYKQLQDVEEHISQLKSECQEDFSYIESHVDLLKQMYDARKYVLVLKERFAIVGFVAVEDVERLKALFEDVNVEIIARPAYSDKRLSPPTKLSNGWFAKPFSMFVDMYGVPEYNGIDPTPIVAWTYSILFGIMFGDVGQGITLMIVGYLASKFMKMKLGEIGIRIGIFSTLFGFIYGSVFGNEHLLDPMFHLFGFAHKPIEIMSGEFIPILLVTAVGAGAILIIFSMLINIYLQNKNKNYLEMIYSQNGICGLVFYVSLLVGGVCQIVLQIPLLTNIIYLIPLIIVPLVLMFLKEAIHHKAHHLPMFPQGFGAYFVESFFELFEIILSFITNTISYLRVGGFVLSHAGMMMAVTLIAEMAGSSGWIAMIIGNIIVMVIEGMIVGIQVLRLEFYEMFSRYFNGNGIAFKSMND